MATSHPLDSLCTNCDNWADVCRKMLDNQKPADPRPTLIPWLVLTFLCGAVFCSWVFYNFARVKWG